MKISATDFKLIDGADQFSLFYSRLVILYNDFKNISMMRLTILTCLSFD